jgi:hypothetical protein
LKNAAFLLAALGLLLLAAWLMLEPEAPRARHKAVEFPRFARPHEIERQQMRSTLSLPLALVPAVDAGSARRKELPTEPVESGPNVDPLHVALAGGEINLVVEAGALKDSPLGRMLLACISPEQSAGLAELEEKTGLKPLEQLDRIALSMGAREEDPVLVLDGDLRAFDPAVLAEAAVAVEYGKKTRLARDGRRAMAVFDGRLLLLGEADAVQSAVARLEGETPMPASSLSGEAYGEVYGSFSGELLSKLMPFDLAARFRGAADKVMLHMDATDDLLLVADVYGTAGEPLSDLGTAIAGALSLGRLQAAREKNPLLADLLDESRVVPGQGSFQLEVALPLETIERELGDCARQGR